MGKHKNIPLKLINKTDPFEFIQNFGKYRKFKNRHAQFSKNLNLINQINSNNSFPYDLSDLINIEYEFENGDIINIDYYFVDLNKVLEKDKNSFSSLNNIINNPILLPDYLESKKILDKKMCFF